MLARKQFGCNLSTMLSKERTDEETNFLRRYRKYSPVIETKCVMNQICKHVEKIDNSIKWDKSKKNVLVDFADFSKINYSLVNKVYDLVRAYNSRKSVRGLQLLAENDGLNNDDISEMFRDKIYTHKDTIRENIRNMFSSEQDMFNHVMYTSVSFNISLDNVWEIMGEYIIDCIPWGDTYVVVRNAEGVEYLGSNLELKEVQ